MRYRIVAGLGNPGREYDGTRHNIGFALLDYFGESDGWHKKWHCAVKELSVDDQRLLLVKPLLYMNRSGDALREVLSFKGIGAAELIVAHDEVDLPLGAVRVKAGGGDAGHQGLRSITGVLGPDYTRVRLGVGRPNVPGREIASWVLGKFPGEDRAAAEDMILRGKDVLVSLVKDGVEVTQQRFHGEEKKSSKE